MGTVYFYEGNELRLLVIHWSSLGECLDSSDVFISNINQYIKMEEDIAELPFQPFIVKCAELLYQSLEANESLRMKYPTESQKFYPSESSLNSLLKIFDEKLQETDLSPQKLLKMLTSSKVLIVLLKTLQHPNADINAAAICIFNSLVLDMSKEIEEAEHSEEKAVEEAFPLYFRMCIWLLENGIIQKLHTALQKMNEQIVDEYETVKIILKLFEALMELSDKTYQIIIKETKLVQFLVNRIMPNFTVPHKTIDDVKFIASDLLIMLLETPQPDQHTMSAVRQLYHYCGMQVLIQTISSYEKQLPKINDEKQYLNNLFDCLNGLLVSVKESRLQFHQMKGSYLMVSYICTKSTYGIGALKAIANSLQCSDKLEIRKNVCEDIINDGSLKYLFPMLMRQGIKGKDIEQQTEIDENLLTIFYFLVKFSDGVTRDRLLNKFTEKRMTKLQRLFQLRGQYRIQEIKEDLTAEEYLNLVNKEFIGIIETIDKMIVSLHGSTVPLTDKINALMKLYNVDVREISASIERNYKFIDEGAQKYHIEKLINQNLRAIN